MDALHLLDSSCINKPVCSPPPSTAWLRLVKAGVCFNGSDLPKVLRWQRQEYACVYAATRLCFSMSSCSVNTRCAPCLASSLPFCFLSRLETSRSPTAKMNQTSRDLCNGRDSGLVPGMQPGDVYFTGTISATLSESVVRLLSSSKEKAQGYHESILVTVPGPRRISWVQSLTSGSEFPQRAGALGYRSFGSLYCRAGFKSGVWIWIRTYPELNLGVGLVLSLAEMDSVWITG